MLSGINPPDIRYINPGAMRYVAPPLEFSSTQMKDVIEKILSKLESLGVQMKEIKKKLDHIKISTER